MLKTVVFAALLMAVVKIQAQNSTDVIASSPHLKLYSEADSAQKKGDDDLAIQKWSEYIEKKYSLNDYAQLNLGQIYFKKQNWELAEQTIQKLLKQKLNSRVSIEASSLLGQIYLQKKDFQKAHNFLQSTERRVRNEEKYPEIIYYLAIAEKGLKQHQHKCTWLLKLYEQYPNHPLISHWGADLADNLIEDEKSNCRFELSDFMTRMRNFMWAGQLPRAEKELLFMKSRIGEKTFEAAQLHAQYFQMEGEMHKALDLLLPFYEQKKSDPKYLLNLANVAAKASESQLSIGSYYSVYQLAPGSQTGKQALYQSAFMSYMFEDYDGASRRFKEYIQKFPQSGVIRDAQWHLAWLQYLKGDFEGSFKNMQNLLSAKRKNPSQWKNFPADRVEYWMAMSTYRQGKFQAAKDLFSQLAKDKNIGYYSIASQMRLNQIDQLLKANQSVAKKTDQFGENLKIPTKPVFISRFPASEFLTPTLDGRVVDESMENEDSLLISQEDPLEEEAKVEDVTTNNPDLKSLEIDLQTQATALPQQELFMRARDLMILGHKDLAKWDLFEIEKSTKNKDHLRLLINEYEMTEQFHRSSFIAQVYFGTHRIELGMDGVKFLWQSAYPMAYSEYVQKFSKEFQIPQELIWGIMRAESSFKRDAVSPVGALGLMQVMPYTGQKVSYLLGDKNFNAYDLLQPESAVRIGSRYLKRLMDKFDQMIPLVAAGYNAGPHRVKNWLLNFGNLDMDEFIDHIPFLETRNYVKRVVSNAHIYAKLYTGNSIMFSYLTKPVPLKIDPGLYAKESWDDI